MVPGEFERRLASVAALSLIAASVMFAALAYWQIFRTDLSVRTGNPRVLAAYSDPGRGRILDREGNILAETLPGGERYYPDASVAHVVGYIDSRFGMHGVELAFNDVLSGGAGGGSWGAAFDAEFRRASVSGLDLRLTIDPAVQAAAAQALGSRRGAVVALDPRNGEVLAMVSVPTYDPGALGRNGEALFTDPAAPLLNRATQGRYPPGSTFKTVTAASALEHGVITPGTPVTCPGEIVVDGFPISCHNVPQGVGTYPFRDAFAYSVNAIFGQLGVEVGWKWLLDTARRFGFGTALDFTIETAPSQVYAPGSSLTKVLLASTAFGQGELQATPLQMAVVAATISNGGELAAPHLGLDALRDGEPVRDLGTKGTTRILSPEVAATMRDLMVAVVANGQANGVSIPGVTVAGKTGTAESGHGTSHAWFIAFAPAGAPTVAVAVVVEDGGQGGVVASPIAGSVLRAAVQR